jgi:hypothetical protein
VNSFAAASANGRSQRVSDILEFLANSWPGERLSLGDILSALGDRGYGILLFVLALPGAIPGVAAFAAIPLALVALQMTIGMPRPWLPRFLAERSISRRDFAAMAARALPYLTRIERLLKPRLAVVTGLVGERLIGVTCVALALLLMIPILFNVPLAIPVAVMALAVIERDGLFAAVGLIAGVAVIGLVGVLGWASVEGALQLAGKYLGM